MGVHQVRAPVDLRQVGGHVSGGQAQAGETDMVVRPVAAVVGAVGCTFTLVELGADQYIDDQAVLEVHPPDLARRQRSVAAQFTDDMDRVVALHYLRIARDQHPHIVQVGHGAGQGSGHIAQAAGFHQIGEFGGDKQDFLAIGIVTRDRPHRVEVNQRGRPANWLTNTLSLNTCSGTDHSSLHVLVG